MGTLNATQVIEIESVTEHEWLAEKLVSVGGSETRLFLIHVTFKVKTTSSISSRYVSSSAAVARM
jgi:hypothetical protein